MYFYVDTKEVVKEPKVGEQFVAWYGRASMNSPDGYPHVDVINGEEVEIRSFDKDALEKFLRVAYYRAPYIKARPITE